MAIYSLNASVISRGKGHSTTAAAAYRARCMILDERTGQVNDYSRKHGDLVFAGIYAPSGAPAWSRQQLWNAVEQSEKRKDARLARDFKIALPHELTPEQNRWLVQDFAREQFARRGYVADVAIHAPHEQGSDLNIHAHIMVTDRQLTPDGFKAKKERDIQSKEYLQELRESWEKLANRHLERHGHEARIDHRSLQAQGIAREPGLHMGKDATAAARKGITTERGERQKNITTRNRRAEELLRELAELQQQQGIAAQLKGNGMGLADRIFHTFESLAAAPFGFIFGNDQSPEQYYRDPDKANTTEINIRTDAVNIQPYAPAAEQAREMKAAEQAPEQAQEMKQAEPTPEAPTPQTALQEQIAREKAYYAAQEQEQEREQEYTR